MSTTRIVTLGRERTLSTLARRVFVIGSGREARLLLRRAEAALLSANPRLRSAEGFRPGASIVVPVVSGLNQSDEVQAAEVGGKGLIAETALRLQVAASRVEDGFQSATLHRKETLEQISGREFAAAARRALPATREHIAKTKDRLQREEAETEERLSRFRKGVDEATRALKQLEALTPRSGRG